MKISKVREEQGKEKLTINARTAVVLNNHSQEGILYDDPSRSERGRKSQEEGDKYIQRRIRNTRKLYSIFNEIKKKPGSKQGAKDILIKAFSPRELKLSDLLKNYDREVERYAEQSYVNRKEHRDNSAEYDKLPVAVKSILSEKSLSDKISDFVEQYNNNNERFKIRITKELIEDVINSQLKNSLKRERFILALKTFLMNTFNLEWEAPDNVDVQRDFIDTMLEDYYRVKTKGLVSESIRRKNMPVQPATIDGEKVFSAPVVKKAEKPGKTKSAEQQSFNQFLLDYADLNESKRNDKLMRIRRLVLLYFYGIEEARKTIDEESFNVWEDHAKHGDDKTAFITVTKVEVTGDKELDKAEKERRKEEIKEKYRRKNIECYRAAVLAAESEKDGLFFDDQMLNLFILHRIENGVERIYKGIKDDQDYKLSIGYLSEKVWKGLLNYISVRYIAVGKAVYNYAMQELGSKSDIIDMGHVDDAYINGITSFDYELIKAEETLQREKAVYVAFASRHLAHQTVELDEKNSDFLLLSDKEESDEYIGKFIKPDIDIRRSVLQYFGGKSIWRDFDFEDFLNDNAKDIDFLLTFKKVIYSMRNDSFHYATMSHDKGSWKPELVSAMFEYETKRIAVILKNKFFSNNVPSFYTDKDLSVLLNNLYKKNVERASQVPAFNSVFVRNSFQDKLVNELKVDMTAMSDDDQRKCISAIYYMFKEIYYNDFLQNKDVRDRFVFESTRVTKLPKGHIKEKVNGWRNEAKSLRGKGAKEKAKEYDKLAQDYIAEDDFGKKILSIVNTYPDYNLAQICQLIMTEYNQQNFGNKRKKSSVAKEKNKDSYGHYKMLLLLNMRRCFEEYVKKAHPFILTPKCREKGDEADFLPEFKDEVNPYGELCEKLAKSAELQKWYIVARLLSPKQANQFLGSLHSYKQYVWDVYRRAKEAGAEIKKGVEPDALAGEQISDIDAILDLCVKLSGTTSNELTDYFVDKEDFAEYVGKFVDYEYKTGPYSAALQVFCESYADEDDKDWMFYDGKNPKMNRNILLSKLYGEEKILSQVFARVGKENIQDYHNKKKEYGRILNQNKGVCDTEEDQKAIKCFQESKNHVELRNLVDYSEILDELQGQLINWVYLRERDLMYFQLGFHYHCIHNDSQKPRLYKTIDVGKKHIDNAILYQICAMYINGVSIYYYSEGEKKLKKQGGATGSKIPAFGKYTKAFSDDYEFYKDENMCYNAGLELFENVKEHDNITQLRNDIDHFRYYASSYGRSMLDLYSEIFDRFFSYDMKYRKNVPNLLYNILLQFFVNTRFEYTSGSKIVGRGEKVVEKACAAIRICGDGGIVSEKFTYKLSGGKDYLIAARNREYLETVARLLNYPHKVDSKGMVKDLVTGKTITGKNYDRRRENLEEKKIVEEFRKKKNESGLSGMNGMDPNKWADLMAQVSKNSGEEE